MAELVYQKKRKDQIRKIVPQIKRLCKKGIEGNYDESQTRNAIIDTVLQKGLGLRFGEDLFSEVKSAKGYCDFLIKYNDKPYMIIEAKKIGYKLSKSVVYQTMGYSLPNQVQWIVLTDGNWWKVYKPTFIIKKNEVPEIKPKLVFETKFLDENETNSKRKERVDKLYLLSPEAHKKDELSKYYDLHQVFDSENLLERILSNEVLDKIRVAIRRDTKFNVTNKELATHILKMIAENTKLDEKQIKKVMNRLK